MYSARIAVREAISRRSIGLVSALRDSSYPHSHSCREYHATEKREIVPLIAAALVVGTAYYSYRAVNRMNEEWQDYQWQLQQYEKMQIKKQQNDSAAQQRTIAIDLGTVFTKIAATHPAVEVAVTREGDRSFFNGIVYDGSDVAATGRAALERFYYNNDGETSVTLPFITLTTEAASHVRDGESRKVVSDVLTPALTEVQDRLHTDDAVIRKVVTLPSAFVGNPLIYEDSFDSLTSFVPEPVAAVWGAQFQDILPENDDSEKSPSYLVVDIGGWTTQVAVVRNDVMVHGVTLPWGGESAVESVVDILKSESDEPLKDPRSLALLQVQARQAVAELSTKTRTSVHVPYLFADPSNHHLDTQVSRNVLDQAIEDHIRDVLIEQLTEDSMSPHMPKPTNLTSMWVSVITRVLEQAEVLPTGLDGILLVGGGAKAPITQHSLSTALNVLMGSIATDKLKQIDPAVQSELTVLGAATLLPSFEYSLADGLVRR